MIKSYKYRLYPTPQQEKRLRSMLWATRRIYNRLRETWEVEYLRRGWSMDYYALQRLAYGVRRQPDYSFLPSQVMLCTCPRRFWKAVKAFYRRVREGVDPDEVGYPKFKSWRFWNSLECTNGNGMRLADNRLRITRAGNLRIRFHRPLPEDALVKYIIVSQHGRHWYVCFQAEIPSAPAPAQCQPIVGIDVGLYHALALSDGTIYDAPKPLAEALQRLRILQRKAARQQKGSNRQKETYRQVARLHEHIASIRCEWWHQVTTELVERYGGFVLENLSLEFMQQNKHLARAVSDVAIGTFWQMLEYKAAARGLPVVRVKAQYTSQTCPACGLVKPKLLSERVHRCECGLVIDRDVSAAIVILLRAIEGDMLPAGVNVGCLGAVRSPRIPERALCA